MGNVDIDGDICYDKTYRTTVCHGISKVEHRRVGLFSRNTIAITSNCHHVFHLRGLRVMADSTFAVGGEMAAVVLVHTDHQWQDGRVSGMHVTEDENDEVDGCD